MVRLHVQIDGTTYPIVESSLNLDLEEGGAIDTCSFTVDNPTLALADITAGSELNIFEEDVPTNRFFGGLITEVIDKHTGIGKETQVTAQDWKLLLDRAFFTKVFDSHSDKEIIQEAFDEAGITEVDTSTLVQTLRADMPRMVFQGYSLRQMMDTIKGITGAYWDINYFKKLIYREELSATAVFDLGFPPVEGGSPINPYFNSKRVRTMRNFNAVEIRGGHFLQEVTDTYRGDGSRTFFKLAIDGVVSGRDYHAVFRGPPESDPDVPIIEVNTGSDGTPTWTAQTVGVEPSQSIDDVDVLFNPLSSHVIFATAPPNFANNSWRINGRYLAQAIAVHQDDAEIAAAGGRIFKRVITVPEVEEIEQARTLAIAFLREQGSRDIIQTDLDADGLNVGDAVNVEDAIYDVNKLYQVHRMKIGIIGGELTRYKVDLGNGPLRVDEMAKVLRDMADAANRFDQPLSAQRIGIFRQVTLPPYAVGQLTVISRGRGPQYFCRAALGDGIVDPADDTGNDAIIAGFWVCRA